MLYSQKVFKHDEGNKLKAFVNKAWSDEGELWNGFNFDAPTVKQINPQ